MTPALARATKLFAHKKVLILGLGLLGGAIGDARFFDSLGATVIATDLKTEVELAKSIQALSGTSVVFHLGGHREADIQQADFIIRNPAIPRDHPLLLLAQQLKKPVFMRSSLFAELAEIPIIGITGTRGKTTTTTMIHSLVSKLSGKKVFLAGNISGTSDLELLSQLDDPDHTLIVMELSSWQLQGFSTSRISPHIAVVTNLYPDHLNRYPSLEAYYQDKQQIVLYQSSGDHAVFNAAQPEFKLWATTIKSQVTWFNSQELPENLHLSIRGDHNRANAAAALAVAKILNLDINKSIEALNQFSGVTYRLQTVAIVDNIEYINDTTATTPDAVIAALDSLPKFPIIICGGADKNLPLERLTQHLNQKVKNIVFLSGTGTDKMINQINPNLVLGKADSMPRALEIARSAADPGDIILLSPGFASFGMFVNEFDRGDQFNQCLSLVA